MAKRINFKWLNGIFRFESNEDSAKDKLKNKLKNKIKNKIKKRKHPFSKIFRFLSFLNDREAVQDKIENTRDKFETEIGDLINQKVSEKLTQMTDEAENNTREVLEEIVRNQENLVEHKVWLSTTKAFEWLHYRHKKIINTTILIVLAVFMGISYRIGAVSTTVAPPRNSKYIRPQERKAAMSITFEEDMANLNEELERLRENYAYLTNKKDPRELNRIEKVFDDLSDILVSKPAFIVLGILGLLYYPKIEALGNWMVNIPKNLIDLFRKGVSQQTKNSTEPIILSDRRFSNDSIKRFSKLAGQETETSEMKDYRQKIEVANQGNWSSIDLIDEAQIKTLNASFLSKTDNFSIRVKPDSDISQFGLKNQQQDPSFRNKIFNSFQFQINISAKKTPDPVVSVQETVKSGKYIPEIQTLQDEGLLDQKLEVSQQLSKLPVTESEIKEWRNEFTEKIDWVNESLALIDDCSSSIRENIKILQKRYQKKLNQQMSLNKKIKRDHRIIRKKKDKFQKITDTADIPNFLRWLPFLRDDETILQAKILIAEEKAAQRKSRLVEIERELAAIMLSSQAYESAAQATANAAESCRLIKLSLGKIWRNFEKAESDPLTLQNKVIKDYTVAINELNAVIDQFRFSSDENRKLITKQFAARNL